MTKYQRLSRPGTFVNSRVATSFPLGGGINLLVGLAQSGRAFAITSTMVIGSNPISYTFNMGDK